MYTDKINTANNIGTYTTINCAII